MTAPAWLGQASTKYSAAVDPDGVLVIRFPGGNHPVKWRSDCERCQRMPADTDFWPDHQAMSGCRSGGHDHCTCDGCF